MSLKCNSCGNELSPQVKFCTRCGALVSQAQSFGQNIEATEPLFAAESATVGQRTEALAPDTEELPEASVSTNKISQPGTAALLSQEEVAAIPTATIQSEPGSPKRFAVFAGFFLLIAAAAAGIYFSTAKPSETSADPVPTPNTLSQSTPIGNSQPLTNPSPAETPTPQPEVVGKASERVGENNAKPKPGEKEAIPPTETAADHIKLGIKAGNPAAALAEYKLALEVDPGNVDVHYLMGMAYQQLGQLNQALEAHRKCTSGTYAPLAAQHVKKLEKEISKSK